jgi:VWFA-related protein
MANPAHDFCSKMASTPWTDCIYPRVIRFKPCLFSVLLLLSAFVVAAADGSAPTIHKTVSEVQLEVVATDDAGRPVQDLSASDIKVLEEGRMVQQFGLTVAHNLPLLTTVIYDTSASNRKTWQQMQGPISTFVQQTLNERDQLWVGGFDSKLRFKVQVHEVDQFKQALNVQAGDQNLTAFNDALLRALRDKTIDNAEARRASMIVFSDGEDNYSIHSVQEVITAAQRAKIAVYTIHRLNKRRSIEGDPVLHAIAAGTGGLDFVVSNTRELESALAVIGQELRSCYLLYYPISVSRTGGEFRRVSVTPSRSNRIHIQVQNGYFLPVDSAGTGE